MAETAIAVAGEVLERSTGVTNPLVLLQSAIDRGIDPEKLGKLMDLAERWQANQAAAAYAAALTGFKKEMPAVFKRRTAGKEGSKVNFSYASIDDIKQIADPLLAKYGIVDSYTTEDLQNKVKVICTLQVGMHYGCPSEITLPIPAGVVNNTQLYAQAVTYGKRYSFCNAAGITVTDKDNDGHGLEDYVTSDQVKEINGLLEQCRKAGREVNLQRFLDWLQVESLDKLPARELEKVMTTLNQRLSETIKANGGKNGGK